VASEEGAEGRVFEAITSLLDGGGAPYEVVRHEPTRTSEESARARGEDLSVGGKALVMKVDGDFKLFVLSASRRLSSRKVKVRFESKDLRFATPDELQRLTGLVPGSVPPFGRPVTPFDCFVDLSVVANERIAFNAGALTASIVMMTRDYLRVAKPVAFDFSE
jgi:Ala-tRNA(Pro) deacylase